MFKTESFWEDSSTDDKNLVDALFGSSPCKFLQKQTTDNVKTAISSEVKKSKRKRGKKKSKASHNDNENTNNLSKSEAGEHQQLHKKMKIAKINNTSKETSNKLLSTNNTSENDDDTNKAGASKFYNKLVTTLESSRFRYINEQVF